MKCHLHHDLWSITIINNKGCLKDSANQFHNVSKEAFMKTVNPSLGLFYGFCIWSKTIICENHGGGHAQYGNIQPALYMDFPFSQLDS